MSLIITSFFLKKKGHHRPKENEFMKEFGLLSRGKNAKKFCRSNTPALHEVIRSKKKWFQLLLPHHWHCKKKRKSWNVQTCESNQVHRRLWLETYAAFFSYDLITRLFSSTVKGGRTLQIAHCLDWFFFLSLTWCVCVSVSSGGEPGFGAGRGGAQVLKRPVTSPWELRINQIIALKNGGSGWGDDFQMLRVF